MKTEVAQEVRVARAVGAHRDESQRYWASPTQRDFSRQYYSMYTARLAAMRDRLEAAARDRWGAALSVLPVHQLEEQLSEECVIVGTLFKQQQLKPSILKEISEEHNLMPQPVRDRFIADADELVLEDDLARVRLEGDIDPQQYVTGVMCALLGHQETNGRFHVRDVCFAEIAVVKVDDPLPVEDVHVVLVSGLGLAAGGDLFLTQMLCDLITGQLGGDELQRKMAQVTRVLIAGNSLSASSKDKDFMKRAAYLSSDSTARSAEAVKSLDEVLVQLVSSCDVDLMPGEFDPANHMLPQQPLHRCLLPRSSRYSTLHAVTNPYQAVVCGRRLVGTAGQNVYDLYRYSASDDPLQSLRRLLDWAHLCPTAPDTLACYPFYDGDPFILDVCPDVLFAGNQRRFATELVTLESGREVRLVCVPEFHRTGSVLLLNLRTLEVEQLCLGAELEAPGEDPETGTDEQIAEAPEK